MNVELRQALVLTHGYFCATQTYTNTTQDSAVVKALNGS